MEETFYQKFAIWVQIIFISLQILGCVSSLGSVIYTYKTFEISKPIYLVAMLDSIVSFLSFLALYGATMTIGIITENDPEYLKGERERCVFRCRLFTNILFLFVL
jgi:hypothetical protein